MHSTLAPKKSRAAAKNGSGPAASSTAKRSNQPAASQGSNSEIGRAIANLETAKVQAGKRAGVPVEKLTSMSAKDQAALANGAGYQLMARSRIGRSPFNRDTFSQADLEKLAADLKIRGILQPLVVRPNPRYKLDADGNAFAISTETEGTRVRGGLSRNEAANLLDELNAPDFELVAGERRWRSAGIAKIAELPVIVRPRSDREAIEDQAVENMQREELNPIHEGEKYQQLLDVYKRLENLTTEQAFARIEEKIHVGKSTIYSRMRLLKLPEEAREAALSGRLPASHAEEIAKLDDAEAQVEVTKRILNPKKNELGDDTEEPSTRSETLLGKCTVMGFRNTKTLIAEMKERLKNRAGYNKLKAEFEKKGLSVLSEKQNAEAFNQWGHLLETKWVGADHEHYVNGQGYKTWRVLLGKDAPSVHLAKCPTDDEAHVLFIRSEAVAVLNKKAPARRASSRPESEVRAEQAHKVRVKQFTPLLGSVAESAEANDSPEIWTYVAAHAIHHCGSDAVWRVVKRRFPDTKRENAYKVLEKWVAGANGKQLRGLAAEIYFAAYSPSMHSGSWGKGFEEACGLFGIKSPAWEVQTSGKEEQI